MEAIAGVLVGFAFGVVIGYVLGQIKKQSQLEILQSDFDKLENVYTSGQKLIVSLLEERLQDPARLLGKIEKDLGPDYLQN